MPTSGLDDAYNTLNMGLESRKNFDRYFVFTAQSAATDLAQRVAIDKEPSKYLLTGIKGCGKTTRDEIRAMLASCGLAFAPSKVFGIGGKP